MKIYQLVEYTNDYDDGLSKSVLHTFSAKKKAEEKLKEYVPIRYTYTDTWYEIEEFEVEN